ncbi:sensor histidine kinase [Uniformispora flossi]|uniref:sensor histidine kinase n=1 Tax=Uniformispora flossi TaxID=3390723 RepID=UPI003C2B1F30
MHVEQQRPALGSAFAPARTGEPGTALVDAVMSASFVVLLVAAMTRFLIRHPGAPDTPFVIALTAALAVGYVLRPPGPAVGPAPRWTKVWLALFTAAWAALVVIAPSFAWSAVPIVYTALRLLGERAALTLVALLTVFVVVAQVRISGDDPLLILGPPAVAALASSVFVYMQRQSERQRGLIEDLIATREGLAASERRAGTLEERQRLSMEIHDTLAQGLSSQQMLLQAAERVWDVDPGAARGHVATASGIAERNLAEARRFVHDLAPADLADGGSLEQALRLVAERTTEQGVVTRFRTDGARMMLPARVEAALLRVAQGAVANVLEHAGASEATVTLTYLGGDVVLDIADNGRGFDPEAVGETPEVADSRRGHGLPAMEARLRQLDGRLTVESAVGDGTVVSAWVRVVEGP